jgi:type I restriction enzyme R subunit
VQALNPREDRSPQEAEAALRQAVKPLANPALRDTAADLKASKELVIDTVTQDRLYSKPVSAAARERAQGIVQSFEAFIAEHRDEITALQILYNRPTKVPLTFTDLKALADALQAPPHLWTESQLWQAYAALDQSQGEGKRVRGASRAASSPTSSRWCATPCTRRTNWCPTPSASPPTSGRGWRSSRRPARASPTSSAGGWRKWPSTSPATSTSRPRTSATRPSTSVVGWGRVHQLFGAELPKVIDEFNRELVA